MGMELEQMLGGAGQPSGAQQSGGFNFQSILPLIASVLGGGGNGGYGHPMGMGLMNNHSQTTPVEPTMQPVGNPFSGSPFTNLNLGGNAQYYLPGNSRQFVTPPQPGQVPSQPQQPYNSGAPIGSPQDPGGGGAWQQNYPNIGLSATNPAGQSSNVAGGGLVSQYGPGASFGYAPGVGYDFNGISSDPSLATNWFPTLSGAEQNWFQQHPQYDYLQNGGQQQQQTNPMTSPISRRMGGGGGGQIGRRNTM